jgi:uncharacterized protein (TIGR04206 family)
MSGTDSSADERGPDTPERALQYRRLSMLVVVALVPWTLVIARGTPTLVFSFGLYNVDPAQLTTITDYYFQYTAGLPQFLLAWGLGALLYALAIGSALLGLFWREDARLTAALLVLAGLTELGVSLGFMRRPGYLALPVGTVVMWLLAWRYYWTDLRNVFTLSVPDWD